MSALRIKSGQLPARTGLTIWALGWGILLLTGHALALEMVCAMAVLTAVLGAVTLNFLSSFVLATASTLAINWIFVPPQGSFIVDLNTHATMLMVAWGVSIIVPGLIVVQRHYSLWLKEKLRYSAEIDQALSALLHAGDHLSLHALCEFFAQLTQGSFSLMLVDKESDERSEAPQHRHIGTPSFEEKTVMWIVCRQGLAFGPLTGQNESLDGWYFPIRQGGKLVGAVQLPLQDPQHDVLLQKKYTAVLQALHSFDRHGSTEAD